MSSLRSTFSPPLSPPVPIAAAFAVATGAWSCTFDKLLQPGVLDHANWSLRASGSVWLPSSASASGAVVSGASTIDAEDPGLDVIHYTAVVPDVLSLRGLPAAAFANFPLVVT